MNSDDPAVQEREEQAMNYFFSVYFSQVEGQRVGAAMTRHTESGASVMLACESPDDKLVGFVGLPDWWRDKDAAMILEGFSTLNDECDDSVVRLLEDLFERAFEAGASHERAKHAASAPALETPLSLGT